MVTSMKMFTCLFLQDMAERGRRVFAGYKNPFMALSRPLATGILNCPPFYFPMASDSLRPTTPSSLDKLAPPFCLSLFMLMTYLLPAMTYHLFTDYKNSYPANSNWKILANSNIFWASKSLAPPLAFLLTSVNTLLTYLLMPARQVVVQPLLQWNNILSSRLIWVIPFLIRVPTVGWLAAWSTSPSPVQTSRSLSTSSANSWILLGYRTWMLLLEFSDILRAHPFMACYFLLSRHFNSPAIPTQIGPAAQWLVAPPRVISLLLVTVPYLGAQKNKVLSLVLQPKQSTVQWHPLLVNFFSSNHSSVI